MKTMIPLWEKQQETHFDTNDLKTKAEAATIYMLSDNYYSADVLFEDLIVKPSNEPWFQIMLALFVFKMGSFEAMDFQSLNWRNWSNLIRSRKLWFLYPALLVTDLFISHDLEVLFAKKYLPTWTYFKTVKYSNKLNDSIYKKLLTN